MKIKVLTTSFAVIDGKVKKLAVGEQDVPEDAAKKLIKNGVARELVASDAAVKSVKKKAVSDEA